MYNYKYYCGFQYSRKRELVEGYGVYVKYVDLRWQEITIIVEEDVNGETTILLATNSLPADLQWCGLHKLKSCVKFRQLFSFSPASCSNARCIQLRKFTVRGTSTLNHIYDLTLELPWGSPPVLAKIGNYIKAH